MKHSSLKAALISLAALSTPCAYAGGEQNFYDFNISEFTVDSAINAVAQQSKSPAIFPFDQVKHLKAPKLSGHYTIEEALSIILKDTGLQATVTPDGVITVLPPQVQDTHWEDTEIMNSTKKLLLGSAAIVGSAVTPITAAAQTPEETSQSRYSLEEITVTSRRVEEGLQQAPLAVTAISGIELENRGALDIVDFADIAPNVSLKTDGTTSGFAAAPRVSIRGVGQSDFVINTDPAVGMYADGVYLGRSLGSVMDLVDVERVEALRGPQGTLFGRNSTGGAINIISKKPDVGGSQSGYVTAAVGEGGYYLLRGSANLPLGETAAVRLSAMKRARDGFIPALQYDDLDLGAEDVTGFRAALRWEPTDALTLDLDGDLSSRSDTAAPFIPVLFGDLGANEPNLTNSGAGPEQRGVSTSVFGRRFNGEGFNPPIPAGSPVLDYLSTEAGAGLCADPTYRDANLTCLGQAWASSREGSNQGWFDANGNLVRPDDQSLDSYGFSARASWEAENFTINTISAWRGFDSSFLNGSPAAIYVATNSNDNFEQDQFSQEVTINGSFSDRIDYIAGVFYQQEEGVEVVTTVFPLAPPAADNTDDFLPINGVEDRNIDNTSQGIFGQLSFDLTDTLELTLGARQTKEVKDVVINKTSERTALVTAANPSGELIETLVATQEVTEPNFLANLSWQATDDVMIYGQFSDGFRNGGFPARLPNGITIPFEELQYGPEFVESFEVGAKTTLLDGALRLNGAIFSTQYTDQQINATALDPAFGQVIGTILNVGESEINGLELEANYLVTDNLRLDMSLGYLDAKLTGINSDDGTLVLNSGTNLDKTVSADDNNSLPFAPELQLSVGGNYSFFLDNGVELRNRLDILHESEQYSTIANYDFGLIPATTRVNYVLTYIPDAPWELSVGARNLTDQEDILNASFNTGPGAAGYHVLGRGREAYASFKYSFGD